MGVTDSLPEGWKRLRLGDCLRLQNGFPFKPTQWSTEGDPIIRIQNLNSQNATYNRFTGELPTKFRARHGDLLFAWSGTPGTSFGAHVWRGDDAWINQHIFRVDYSTGDFDRDFLMFALNLNLNSYIAQAQGGVGLAHITKAKLNESLLIAPPINEQKRIAVAIAASERHRQLASQHLSNALTALANFASAVLANSYTRAGAHAPDSAKSVRLDQILREPLKNGYSARPVSRTTPYRVLTLTATTSGWFDGSHFKYTDEEFPPGSPFWLLPGDIVVQRGNTAEYVGVPALYEGAAEALLYPDLMIRARVRPEIDPRFVWYMLLAPQVRDFLRQRATGSAGNMPKINQAILSQVPLPLPADGLRVEIVQRLDAIFELVSNLRKRITRVQRRAVLLDSAILNRAFEGTLIPTSSSLAAEVA